jgi:hypothetical protein
MVVGARTLGEKTKGALGYRTMEEDAPRLEMGERTLA